MNLTKIVDGVRVSMSVEESAALQTEWSSNLSKQRPVPDLTFAQLLIGLVTEGWITEQQGENWLQGILPAPVTQLIATLPQEQRFVAKARAARPSVVVRSDSLVNALGAAQGKTSAELDSFFKIYAQV